MSNRPHDRAPGARLGVGSHIRVTTEVTHRCGHRMRWTWFGPPAGRPATAALAECARCEYEHVGGLKGFVPCDIVWPATGVSHAHEGECPDSALIPWLADMGALIGRQRIIATGAAV